MAHNQRYKSSVPSTHGCLSSHKENKTKSKPDVVTYAGNPNTWEAKAGGLWVGR